MGEHRVVWVHGLLPDDIARFVGALADSLPYEGDVRWAGPSLTDLQDYFDADVEEYDKWPDPLDVSPGDLLVVDASGMAPGELAARLSGPGGDCTVVLRESGEWAADLTVAQPGVLAAGCAMSGPGWGEWPGKTAWLHAPSGLAAAVAGALARFADYWVSESTPRPSLDAPVALSVLSVLSVLDLEDLAAAHHCEWPFEAVFVVDGRGMGHDALRAVLNAVPLTDGMEFQGMDISEPNDNRILVLRDAADLGPDARAFAPGEGH